VIKILVGLSEDEENMYRLASVNLVGCSCTQATYYVREADTDKNSTVGVFCIHCPGLCFVPKACEVLIRVRGTGLVPYEEYCSVPAAGIDIAIPLMKDLFYRNFASYVSVTPGTSRGKAWYEI